MFEAKILSSIYVEDTLKLFGCSLFIVCYKNCNNFLKRKRNVFFV